MNKAELVTAIAQTTGQNRHGAWWRMKNPSLGASVNQYLKGKINSLDNEVNHLRASMTGDMSYVH